ncbi:MAG: hypothetical protein M1816_002111 [Peltula sp. TS41687]|nr:MAG: hypothetical protein M1816_002111 [Peltula sp. TS41687]
MTENAPPPTTTTNSSAPNADSSRGLPYYEKLRRDLRETLAKKRVLDKNLASLEDQIYKFENSYLEETSAGNIIKGFDNYVKGSSSTTGGSLAGIGGGAGAGGGGVGGGRGRRGGVNDLDRVFSRSSASYLSRDSPAPTPPSHQTTPSHAPTRESSSFAHRESSTAPAGNTGTAAGPRNNKKNKKGGAAAAAATTTAGETGANVKDDNDDGGNEDGGRKRMKFTFGGRVAGE